ncbi:hypothetical protein [Rhizobium sp. SL86]|uniref:hypothetical protein n=1 Tax=Rhizobium sp. SL86 TaxID=2995148 RepID=UPI0022724C24|nr:hypothetical protein [Rhizobium sp. SL86]MCY1666200.1 hypothetical protein [Rhizobium sp. SL86]
MVSALDSTRLWSMQTTLRIMKEEEARTSQEDSSESSASSILAQYGVDTSEDDSSDSSTYTLADYLTGTTSSDTDETSEETVSDDIESTSFMKGLKAKLEEMTETSSTKAQAEAMLAALEAGTLTVTDAQKGETITAWDVEAEDVTANTATTMETSEWSSYLRDHLSRESGGKYALNEDGSYTDKATGNSAYFGMVGDSYYYLSWPAAS